MPHDVRAIGNAMLDLGRDMHIKITTMQLVKLVYFAHGWCLSIMDKPLSTSMAQAWQHGPVFRDLYDALPQDTRPIKHAMKNFMGRCYTSKFTAHEQRLMTRVLHVYGALGFYDLSEKCRHEGSPWDITVDTSGYYASIDNELVRRYFLEQAQKNAARRAPSAQLSLFPEQEQENLDDIVNFT